MAKGEPIGNHADELKSEKLAIHGIESMFKKRKNATEETRLIFEDMNVEWEITVQQAEALTEQFALSGRPEGEYLEMLCDWHDLTPLQIELLYLEKKYGGEL